MRPDFATAALQLLMSLNVAFQAAIRDCSVNSSSDGSPTESSKSSLSASSALAV